MDLRHEIYGVTTFVLRDIGGPHLLLLLAAAARMSRPSCNFQSICHAKNVAGPMSIQQRIAGAADDDDRLSIFQLVTLFQNLYKAGRTSIT
jgi:hypothetical protein